MQLISPLGRRQSLMKASEIRRRLGSIDNIHRWKRRWHTKLATQVTRWRRDSDETIPGDSRAIRCPAR